jgi:hypothetical protein
VKKVVKSMPVGDFSQFGSSCCIYVMFVVDFVIQLLENFCSPIRRHYQMAQGIIRIRVSFLSVLATEDFVSSPANN